MTTYKTMHEAIDSIGYGMCSICQAEHEFPNIKCDLMHQDGETMQERADSTNPYLLTTEKEGESK